MRRVLIAVLILAGCDSQVHPPPPKRAPEPGSVLPAPQAGHSHEAPHGGTLVELGDHFANLEFVLDASTGTITAYVLDGHADQAIRIEQKEIVLRGKTGEVTLQAVGSPLTGEKPGDTSQFEGRSEALQGAKEFDGTIVRVVVKGRELAGVPLRLQPRPKQD